MTVNLTRIYTRLGDSGETHLGDMSRVPKTHPRIEAYGTVDELNSHIGLTVTVKGVAEEQREWLRRIQNDLFDVGADLCTPGQGKGPDGARLTVTAAQVAWLESEIDRFNAALEPLRSFVLPGGTAAAAHLHLARTICRRAERLIAELGNAANEPVTPELLKYVNRLSDFLFVASRYVNEKGTGDVTWKPGQNR